MIGFAYIFTHHKIVEVVGDRILWSVKPGEAEQLIWRLKNSIDIASSLGKLETGPVFKTGPV